MTQALRRGILEVPNSAEAHVALAQLNVRLSRLKSVRLAGDAAFLDETTRALFVNYGSAILNAPTETAPPETAPPETAPPETARSTHDADGDADGVLSYDDLRSRLGELCQWLAVLKISPRRVFSLGDLDSQVLARALADQLNVEFAVADGDGFTHSKSLIVSVDNRALLDFPLRTVFPAQVLYAFNLHREGGGIMPDVTGVSQGKLVLPWQEDRLTQRKINGVVERILAATPEPAELAAESAGFGSVASNALTAPISTDWQSRLEFYRERRQWLTAGNSCYSRPSLLPELR